MEVSGQLQALAALPPRRNHWKGWWWGFGPSLDVRELSLAPFRFRNPDHPALSLLTSDCVVLAAFC